MEFEQRLKMAAEAIAQADALVIGAGAGMGVDSGLPDFRGPRGFWKAYPPYETLGLQFTDLANPRWFRSDPAFAWGFYGHRLNLYRQTRPHEGFQILRDWGERKPLGLFAFTSNVDGQFQRGGFDPDRVVEAHGAIDWLQCTASCGVGIFPADGHEVAVDEATMNASDPLPSCPRCGELARPNILMFGDWDWDSSRTDGQMELYQDWVGKIAGKRVAIVEIGAGSAVPTVRNHCERYTRFPDAMLIRINPREPEVPRGQLGFAMGAVEALRLIAARI